MALKSINHRVILLTMKGSLQTKNNPLKEQSQIYWLEFASNLILRLCCDAF